MFPTCTAITITITACSLFCSQRRSSNHDFGSHATSHKADRILTQYHLLCLALLKSYTFSLTKVLEAEDSHSRLLKNSIATAYICARSYLSVPLPHMLVVIGLLRSYSTYFLVCILFTLLCVHLRLSHADVVGLLLGTSSCHFSM